jgi:hypothetical protein
MMKMIPTTDADLEKLKARAKVLKRNLKIRHREGLERAAREAGYLHWHHATQCRAASHDAALLGSLEFVCASIVKDALKGETHYVGLCDRAPRVVFSNGRGDAVLIDIESPVALPLVLGNVEQPRSVQDVGDALLISWTATYEMEADCLKLTTPSGRFTVAIDAVALAEAIEDAQAGDEGGDSDFDHVFGGVGLLEITDEVAAEMLSRGFSQASIDEARSSGAMYSRPRNSVLGPFISSEF